MTMTDHEGLTPTTENILNFLKSTDENDDDDVSNVDFINLQPPSKRQKLDDKNINNDNNNPVQDSVMMTRDNNHTSTTNTNSNSNSNTNSNTTATNTTTTATNTTTHNTIWNFVNYKRPFIDEYSRELSFQINNKDCTLIFNKLERMIYLDIVGTTAEKFESLFGPILLRSQGIDIQSYKMITTKPILNDDDTNNNNNNNSSNNNLSPTNSLIKTDKMTDYNTHLIIPTCLSISNTMINGQLYTGDFSEFFDCSSENVLDLPDITRAAKYTLGSHLYLSKSIWKLAIDSTTKSMVLLAIKLDAFNSITSYGQQLEFL